MKTVLSQIQVLKKGHTYNMTEQEETQCIEFLFGLIENLTVDPNTRNQDYYNKFVADMKALSLRED